MKLNSKTDYFRRALLAASCIALFNCGGSGNQALPEIEKVKIELTLTETLDRHLDSAIQATGPGASVLIRHNGEKRYEYAKGKANSDQDIDISLRTGFRLASISKTFTALAIMQLWEKGRIQLDDTVGQFLPDVPRAYQNITVEQLLTHTSGIPDFINDVDSEDLHHFDGLTNEQLLSLLAGFDRLEFQPGSRGEYSNSGYIYLAEIVAAASGMSFSDYMQTFIFDPIGMDDTYIIDGQFPASIEDALNFAATIDVLGFDSQTHGSSGQVSSAEDLNLFVDALLNFELINEATFEVMIQRRAYLQDIDFHYSYGWLSHDTSNNLISHTGGFDGYQTLLHVDLENDIQVIMLTNGGAPTRELYYQVRDIANQFLID